MLGEAHAACRAAQHLATSAAAQARSEAAAVQEQDRLLLALVLLALLPVTAVVFGMIFLDQMPTAIEYFGIALVLTGVVIQQRDVLAPTSESA